MHPQRPQQDAQQHSQARLVGEHGLGDEFGSHFLAPRRLERREKYSIGEHGLTNIHHGIGLCLVSAAQQPKQGIAQHSALGAGQQQGHEPVVGLHQLPQGIPGSQGNAIPDKHQHKHQ